MMPPPAEVDTLSAGVYNVARVGGSPVAPRACPVCGRRVSWRHVGVTGYVMELSQLNMQRTGLFVLLMVCVFAAVLPVGAQDGTNLLRDGSFDGAYTGRNGRPDFNIPADWSVIASGDPFAFPHNGPDPDPQQGPHAINFDRVWTTYMVTIYQQVSVPEGSNVRGSAYGYLHTCLVPKGHQKCGSVPDYGAYIKVGIDPNGGTNPNDGDVVWSGPASPHDHWQEIAVEATATGGTVTFFIFTTQTQTPQADDKQWETHLNKAYFDNASLVIGGAGGANPGVAPGGDAGGAAAPAAPPPPQYASRVTAQDERSDGSIVHVVQPGDTIDAIAVAYGLTRADILELNNISDPRIIQIGQELKISEGSGSGSRGRGSSADDEADADAPGDAGDDGEAGDEADAESTRAPRAYLAPDEAAPAPVVSVASGKVLPARNLAATSATLCVTMFDDANQNRIQEDGEAALAGGEISVRSEGNELSDYTTDGASEPHCIEDLAPGTYVAVATAPNGYGLTTPNQFRIDANPGATIHVAFGAAEGVVPAMIPPPDDVAPVEEATTAEPAAQPDPIRDNLGLAVFGLAGVVLVAGTGASLVMRRR